jgi:hypothetical protein
MKAGPFFMARGFLISCPLLVAAVVLFSFFERKADAANDTSSANIVNVTGGEVGADRDRVVVPAGPLEAPVARPARLRATEQQTRPSPVVTLGRFTSVQVNVNAQGEDVLNDAANEPSMAVDPTNPDIVVIGWRHFSTVLSNFREAGIGYSHDGGATWTFPGVLDPGQFRSDPVLAADGAGNFYFSSLSALDSVEVFRSADGGVTWSAPVSAFGGDKQWMTVDATSGPGGGNVYQIWNVQFTCCPPNDFTRSVDGGVSFQGPFALPTPSMKWGTLSVGPDGELYSAGTSLNQATHLVTRSDDAQNALVSPTWEPVVTVNLGGSTSFGVNPNPQGLLGQVGVATDHSVGPTRGHVYVLGSVNPPGTDPLDVHLVRSTDGGATWSAPVRVNDDPVGTDAFQWFGTLSVAPNGRIDVIWYDTRGDVSPSNPTTSQVYYSFSTDAGVSWSPNQAISPVFEHGLGYPQQAKLGDYIQSISLEDEVYLTYAATFTGGQDVYFMRFRPTCEPFGCDGVLPPLPEENGVDKNRYLSFVPENPGRMTALRVTLGELPSPFGSSEGETMWVGEPQLVEETASPQTFFTGAPLVCQPVYHDWGSEGLIHVFSEAIVPNALYEVQAIDELCDTSDVCNYSAALLISTAQRWGDVVSPFGGVAQPNFGDVAALLSKFRDEAGAIIKARADLVPNVPDGVANFADVSAGVDAFRGLGYPGDGPVVCP